MYSHKQKVLFRGLSGRNGQFGEMQSMICKKKAISSVLFQTQSEVEMSLLHIAHSKSLSS